MIGVLKKIWRFAGKEQANISKSIFWGFFYAVFHMLQVAAIYFVVPRSPAASKRAAQRGCPCFCWPSAL